MDTQRIIALIVFVFSGMMLWEAWNKHNHPPVPGARIEQMQAAGAAAGGGDKSAASVPGAAAAPVVTDAPKSAGRVLVETDTLRIELDTQGGDIRAVTLLKHPARGDAKTPFSLMQEKAGTYFIAQSGLLGTGLPNHTAKWVASAPQYNFGTGDSLEVKLTNADTPGVRAIKTYSFKRGSYTVNVRHDIQNETTQPIAAKAYFQFLRDGNPPAGEGGGNFLTAGVNTYTGPAIYTEAKKFQKVDFSDIEKNKQTHVKESADGWLAMVQHYFVSAWLPQGNVAREFQTRKISDKLYTASVIVPMAPIAAGASGTLDMPLYVGPQEQEQLKKIAPGLDLVVDYGWLTVLAYPMFFVLSLINNYITGNWGWTIIIFTILLKLVFFQLNQKAGKSMAHMKLMAPKMEALKARYGDDKMKLNQAMMELYKTEKINPLGGCLPILVQMPFLIAMYWVLLGAVELRNAPWIGWITDLSIPDPLFILPIIMGASMIIQTRLNPTPPDPVQAKVMMVMPVVFSVMFFFFPAGLVLYWTTQNILGIGQQWYINKITEQIATSAGKPAIKKS